MGETPRRPLHALDGADVEPAVREELDSLGRIVDEQELTIATLRRELDNHSAALGWRLQQRLQPVRRRMLGLPVLRHVYRTAHRALELWVDDGFVGVGRQIGVKFGRLVRGERFLVDSDERPRSLADQYQAWLNVQGAVPPARDRLDGPLVSVLTTIEAADGGRLTNTVATLQRQTYKRWELCVAMAPSVCEALQANIASIAAAEPRVRISCSIAGTPTLSDAYRVAGGDFIGLIQTDDELAPEALFELIARLQEEPGADVVYSDEDGITAEGRRADPLFKPDWSPVLLWSINYLECFGLVRKRLVDEIGGFSADFVHGQSYDLMLRVTEKTERVAHVPKVLYHRRRRATTLADSIRRRAASDEERSAVASALARRGCRGHVSAMPMRHGPRAYEVRLDLAVAPLVSIIIPTRNNRRLLQNTIDSIRSRTDYRRYEILVLDNGSTRSDTLEYIASLPPGCQVHRWNYPFNYSAINNFGVRHAQGEQLLFLNDDVEVISPDWLQAMLEHAQRPDVGVVGAKLLYGDGRIQHAGVVVGVNQGAVNAFRRRAGQEPGPPRLADLAREVSAVTGACMMVRRTAFDQVNGFDESLPVVLNDTDLCLRVRKNGYSVLYTPHAQLYHYEGSSRGRRDPQRDREVFQQRWADLLTRVDPYYNVNLTDRHDDWSLRLPGQS